MNRLLIPLCCLLMAASCTNEKSAEVTINEIEVWDLSNRMLLSAILGENQQGVKLFDSLLNSNAPIEPKVINLGLELLQKEGQSERVFEIFSNSSEEVKFFICKKGDILLTDVGNGEYPCANYKTEEELPTHPEVQKELVVMYYNDQTVRGGDKSDLLEKYSLNADSILYGVDGVETDLMNREKLKNIILKIGFPTKAMVGDDGMQGAFFVIQHSDGDIEFQKSQFPNIEVAVKNGDLDGQKYALLYDRIAINSGEPQLYGTQFANVDRDNNIAELAPVLDIENLDIRRREMDMMPIAVYKELMLAPM